MSRAVTVRRLPLLALATALLWPGARARAAAPGRNASQDVGAMMADVEAEIGALRKVEPAQSPWAAKYAELLAGELAQVRAVWDGKEAPGDGKTAELYAVGFYEGAMPDGPKKYGVAEVEVRVTGRPVVLVLSAYEPIRWKVRIGEGVRIEKILVGGYGDQLLDPPPPGVPVETHSHKAGDRNAFYLFPRAAGDSESNEASEEKLRTLAGMPVATLQGAYRYGGQPVVVGPADEGWRRQRVVGRLEPLWREATAVKRAEGRESVSAMRFTAIRWAPGGRMFDMAGELTDGTPAGWFRGTGRRLPGRITHVAADPRGPAWYAVGDRAGPFLVDLANGTAAEMQVKEDIPEFSWQSGVAFDTKRNRLLVSAMRYLYAYDPAADKWSIVRELAPPLQLQALTYSASEDCLYGIESGFGGRQGLKFLRFDPDGKPAGDFTVNADVSRDPMIQLRSPPQVVSVGERLVVVMPPRINLEEMMRRGMNRPPQPGAPARQPPQQESPPGQCVVIDPKTAEVVYTGDMVELPESAARPASRDAAELAKLWEALAKAPPADVDKAAAALALGGDGAVAAIRLKLPAATAPDPTAVKALLARLDGDDWKQREAAAADLASAGGTAEPQLREARANAKSDEARQRLDAVLKHLQTLSDPVTSAEDLDKAAGDTAVRARLRAVRALARVRTPAAARLLREIAGGAPGSVDAVQARRALAGL
jgi:hypothetical protein